jgi:hypothetical protein
MSSQKLVPTSVRALFNRPYYPEIMDTMLPSSIFEDRSNFDDEGGFVTAEYAVGIIAAVAFAGVLLAVVKSGAIKSALAQIIQSALSV